MEQRLSPDPISKCLAAKLIQARPRPPRDKTSAVDHDSFRVDRFADQTGASTNRDDDNRRAIVDLILQSQTIFGHVPRPYALARTVSRGNEVFGRAGTR